MKRMRSTNIHSAIRLREAGLCTDESFRTTAYSTFVPSSTFVDVEGVPPVTLRRFTPCGKYLIGLSRNSRDLVVYRFEAGSRRTTTGPSVTSNQFDTPAQSPPKCVSNFVPEADGLDMANVGGGLLGSLPVPVTVQNGTEGRRGGRGCHFGRFFTQMYETSIAQGNESLMRDFCLCTSRGGYIVLASFCTGEGEENREGEQGVAVASVPVLDSFTLHLVEIETGVVKDRFRLLRDFVPLEGHSGVHLRGDLLLVLSIRRQIIHVIKIQESVGRFVEQVRVGNWCREDDEMCVAEVRDREANWRRREGEASVKRRRVEEVERESGLGGGKLRKGFYTGLMQRLLVFVYRKHHMEGNENLFYRVVGQYSQLVMLKAQFLDEDHLLIRLGSHEQSRTDNVVNFFVVYCISTTHILNLFENRSTELLGIYDKYRDLFIGDAAVSATLPPSRTALEDGSSRGEANMRARLKRTRAELAVLPVSCQCGNVSVYLDRRLFSYNAERMGGLDATRPVSLRDVQAVKFIGVQTGRLRFKLAPGIGERGRKRKALFLFHPLLPFVISMEFSVVTPTLFNFHVYGFHTS